MKFYTFLTQEEIAELAEKVKNEPHLRQAQKVLAKEIVTLVHGEAAYNQAVKISEALFSGKVAELSAEEIALGFKDVPSVELKEDMNLVDVLVFAKAASSKREARTFIENGAVSINGTVQKDLGFTVSKADAISGQYTILRRGKKNYYLLKH